MRLASFKHSSKVLNVTLYYFKKGISFIMKYKGNKEQMQSTGGAGGFRSVEYVTLLIQIFMAVSKYTTFVCIQYYSYIFLFLSCVFIFPLFAFDTLHRYSQTFISLHIHPSDEISLELVLNINM
jgi:hypothetical protein